jgi:DNA recombination protein RmuC
MDSTLSLIVILAVAAVAAVAAAAGWFVARSRVKTEAATAAAATTAGLQVELATTAERLRAAEIEARQARDELRSVAESAEQRRDALDTASNELARLEERASRVPALEGELRQAREELHQAENELADSEEENAKLQERASRVPTLEASLGAAEQRAESLAQELASLRASAGEESGKLRAQLEATARAAEKQGTELAEARTRLLALEDLRAALSTQLGESQAGARAQAEDVSRLERELDDTHKRLKEATQRATGLNEQLIELQTRTDKERQGFQEQLQLLLDAKTALADQFRNLANEILEEKSKRFAEQNQTTLGALLEPLKTKLTEFQGKVEEVYVQESKDRSALQEQVKHLMSLNRELSDDAKNLTRALKGSAKAQGNWGELILERVLEASGLRKGIEYVVQDTQHREDGSRMIPDVVIQLPEDRKLVVDAKVSLLAYERHVSAGTDSERATALKAHLDSVRTHIRGLSEKRYHDLYGLKSLDFVLAFIPIEPAFMLAVTNDPNLFNDAWERNVLLVSPSTLLFVVRTVAHLWRQEAQSRNAQDIAKRGADLYEKLCGFVGDLEKVGERLKLAQEAYSSAHSRLVSGKGNAIRQAEMLRELGVKPGRNLPASLVETATDNDFGAEPGTHTTALAAK